MRLFWLIFIVGHAALGFAVLVTWTGFIVFTTVAEPPFPKWAMRVFSLEGLTLQILAFYCLGWAVFWRLLGQFGREVLDRFTGIREER
jgi:hypothetical protein